jgi:hypothetical protein
MSKKTIKISQAKQAEEPVVSEEKQEVIQQNPIQLKEEMFPKELLVKSKQLEQFNLHKDIIRAILVNDSYTLSGAKEAIQKYIDSFNH